MLSTSLSDSIMRLLTAQALVVLEDLVNSIEGCSERKYQGERMDRHIYCRNSA